MSPSGWNSLILAFSFPYRTSNSSLAIFQWTHYTSTYPTLTLIFFCAPGWQYVYTDVTPRQRVVVECWISLQGITQRPRGNHLPPTKTQRGGGGDYCSEAGLEELCVTKQRIFVRVCVCVVGQRVSFSTEKCTVSLSGAYLLPFLHLCVSGIRLPAGLYSSAHFPSRFPPSLEELIAKFTFS